MTHVNGHPVIDKMAHAFGIAPKHTHNENNTNATTSVGAKTLSETDKVNVPSKNQVVFGEHKHNISKNTDNWVPFKSSQTGTAVGAMTGQITGTVAGFASAAIVAGVTKNYKMAAIVGGSVYLTSLGVGAIAGTVGYKTRSMNVDTTEPAWGSMNDTPAQAKENMKKMDDAWSKAFKK